MRGSIQQRSKGSWRLRYDGPQDPTGKRKQVTETVRGTRQEAERVLRERLAALETGGYVARTKETVGTFLSRWLASYVAINTSRRTQYGYQASIKRYVLPCIGGFPLQALTARHIEKMYGDMLDRGLSPTTALNLHRILREAFGHAVKHGVLTRNVTDLVTPPRARRKKIVMWDAETIQRFLKEAAASPYRDFYHLKILTGMRRSELVGLKWDCVDFENATIRVVRTLQRIPGSGLVEGQPKTARSRRSIALSQSTVKILHQIRGKQIEQTLIAGDAWQHTGLVFTKPDGQPIDPDAPTHDFADIVRKANLPPISLHGLRHAHATLLLTAGIHPKIVSERLGHSSIATTMDTYSHVLPGLQEAAAMALDETLGRGSVSGAG